MSSDPAEPAPSAPVPDAQQASPATDADALPEALKLTRAGALWSALIVGFLILILLLVFIMQNTASVDLAFLVWHWSLPAGVAILLAAVGGGLVTVAVGTARIYQLRRAAKKHLGAR
jgi:uncharacterized integral membrane protein